MARNKRNSISHRPGRRARPKQRRARQTLPSNDRTGSVSVDLMTIAAVDGQPTKFDLTFSREVIVDETGTPTGTDFQLVAGGETTRTLSAVEQTAPNVVRVTMSGALTAMKTYTGTVATNAGVIRPEPAAWGIRAQTIDT